MCLQLIDELATVVADLEAENEDDSAAVADKIELHKNTALELHDAIMKRYNQGTLQLLKVNKWSGRWGYVASLTVLRKFYPLTLLGY